MELVSEEARADPNKYVAMFTRRAAKGQCVNQPYLGCREFAARFRLIEDAAVELQPEPTVNGDLGWMLYDLDFTDPSDPKPQFFRALFDRGVMDLEEVEVRG
jgi:CRISPR-associated protein Cas5d